MISCVPKYLPLKPVEKPMDIWNSPISFESQKDIFKNSEGIQVYDYSILIDLGSPCEVLIVHYDLEPKDDSYGKIVKDIYPNSPYKAVSKFNLPKPSATFWVDITKFLGTKAEAIVAIVPHYQNGLIGIAFSGINFVDEKYVEQVISSIAYHGIPKNLIVETSPDSISFGNIKFKRHYSCSWMGPRNLSCYPNGQMNWSIHDSLSEANRAIKLQIDRTLSQDVKILRDDTIKVVFAGINTKARRLKLKASYPIFPFMSQSDILYAYYVATEFDGKYIHWVGSFFEDQAYPGNLAPLFYEVMNYSDPVNHRIFLKREFPNIELLSRLILQQTGFKVKAIQTNIDEQTTKISFIYNDTSKALDLILTKANSKVKVQNDIVYFLHKISKFKEAEVSTVTDHLNSSICTLVYSKPDELSDQEWQIKRTLFNYLIDQCEGLLEIDHAGFYLNDKLILRL
jgi:hypothetical protein